jgi:hypothetical protein
VNHLRFDCGTRRFAEEFQLCYPLQTQTDMSNLFNWINNAIQYMAMADYPYPATFLGPMPGYPVNVSCSYFTNADPTDAEMLTSLKGAGVFGFPRGRCDPGAIFSPWFQVWLTCFTTGRVKTAHATTLRRMARPHWAILAGQFRVKPLGLLYGCLSMHSLRICLQLGLPELHRNGDADW